METKDLPIVEPNLTQHGEMHDTILKNGIRILYESIKEHRTNGCTISLVYNNDTQVELEIRIVSEEPINKSKDTLHLDEIKKQGE